MGLARWGPFVVLIGACGGSAAQQTGPCGGRENASYLVDFTQRSGDCGPVTEELITPAVATGAVSACSGGPTITPDNCTVTSDTVCPFSAGDRAETEHLSAHWAADGSTGQGIDDIMVTTSTGDVLCRSTYDVFYTRQ